MIRREDHDDVVVLTLEHGKANALDVEFLEAIRDVLDALDREEPGAVVLTGRGKIFSAGVDLLRVKEGREAYLERFLPALDEAFHALFTFRRPVLAALNGHAIAGGCVMALAADLRIASDGSGKFGLPELSVGVPFPITALEIVRHAVGPAMQSRFLLEGEMLGMSDAHQHGMVDAIVPADALMEETLKRANRLAALPDQSFSLTKAALRESARRAMADHEAALGDAIRHAWMSDEVLDHIAAYVARTLAK